MVKVKVEVLDEVQVKAADEANSPVDEV
ncbi:MAG: hypothetical protein BTN85_1238 [Candidatus Methanohalarchaeum thermophilum]|uniref:Uncharacterized protein n=1 Tax=Methanohalarchaeum thermophilum TaxID=1903181 RepID=A0A1Q6DWK2_METT1|nr:MAG: hypothetical protein BTN85_1238 [Candidatus Methanohalarchaeum thermophilum]